MRWLTDGVSFLLFGGVLENATVLGPCWSGEEDGWFLLGGTQSLFFISRSLPFLSRRAFYILNGVSRSASFFLHDLTLVDPSPTAWTLGQLPEIIDALSCFFNTGPVVISLHLGCFTAKLGYCLVMGHSWGCHSRTIAMI